VTLVLILVLTEIVLVRVVGVVLVLLVDLRV
jgi:hypothetical protein